MHLKESLTMQENFRDGHGDNVSAESELRLLLDVLRGVDDEKHAMQGDEKEVRAAQRVIDAAYMAIYCYAPHLLDAARKARP